MCCERCHSCVRIFWCSAKLFKMTIDVLKALPNDTKRNSQLPNVARSRRPVRRSLFGEVDHDESMKFLQQELNSIHESQSKRWNFDFQDEKPINSSSANYEWLPVQPNDEIPKAYALSRLPFLSANSECTSVQQTCDQPQSEDSHVELRLQESAVTSNVTKRTTSVQRSIRGKWKIVCRPLERM